MSLRTREAIGEACDDVLVEALKAVAKHGEFRSAHEAYGVLVEEVAEFFDEVRKKRADRDVMAMRGELIQVAAVAVKAAACLTF